MTSTSRPDEISSFRVIKGSLVTETYNAFHRWDPGRSMRENLDRVAEHNAVNAKSANWLRDVLFVLHRRFDPSGRDLALVTLARGGCPLDVWRPALLWHIARGEVLVREFLEEWLFASYQTGTQFLRTEDLHPYLRSKVAAANPGQAEWSKATLGRVSAGLLRIAADFGLLRGKSVKQFAGYHLPEQSFLYLLHAIHDATGNARSTIDSADWRRFLMRPEDVEREILRLHQYRKLDYQVAGSLAQLRLPCRSAPEFAERMVA